MKEMGLCPAESGTPFFLFSAQSFCLVLLPEKVRIYFAEAGPFELCKLNVPIDMKDLPVLVHLLVFRQVVEQTLQKRLSHQHYFSLPAKIEIN